MENIFEIIPKRPISGVLPNNKRIMDTIRMPLNRAEFLRCLNAGTVYAVVGESKILITEPNYDKAIKLFEIQKRINSNIKSQLEKNNYNRQTKEVQPLKVEPQKEIKEEQKVEEVNKEEPVEESSQESTLKEKNNKFVKQMNNQKNKK